MRKTDADHWAEATRGHQLAHDHRRQGPCLDKHPKALLWFYGLPGSGKSTLAQAVSGRLRGAGVNVYVLDGDILRTGLNRDLGFSPKDRHENIRRTAEVGRLLLDAGLMVMAAFITPYEKSRGMVRQIMRGLPYYECFVSCSLEECIRRDPKGLYQKSRQGQLSNLTGMGSPFEAPSSPDLLIDTEHLSIDEAVQLIWDFMAGHGLVPD